MADLKISQLTDGDPALATDEIPAARSGANVKLTAQSIADLHADAVDSVNGQTGAVSLDAADVGAAAAAFTTIAVSGQSNVVADSTADTLTLAAGSNITITTDAGTDTVTIAGSATPSDFQPAIVTNSYYSSPILAPTLYSNDNVGNGVLLAHPIWFSHTETWTRIVANVITGTGSASDKIRLGIWANATGNVPGALLVDSGELSLQTAAEISATISQSLTANTLYWAGRIANNAAEIAALQGGAPVKSLSGVTGISAIADASGADQNAAIAYLRSVAYGALPDPFGTPTGVSSTSAVIWLRKV